MSLSIQNDPITNLQNLSSGALDNEVVILKNFRNKTIWMLVVSVACVAIGILSGIVLSPLNGLIGISAVVPLALFALMAFKYKQQLKLVKGEMTPIFKKMTEALTNAFRNREIALLQFVDQKPALENYKKIQANKMEDAWHPITDSISKQKLYNLGTISAELNKAVNLCLEGNGSQIDGFKLYSSQMQLVEGQVVRVQA